MSDIRCKSDIEANYLTIEEMTHDNAVFCFLFTITHLNF